MTAEELLQQLETMTHAERVRTMIALGRRNDSDSRTIVAALEQGGFYERFMALYSCFGSQDSAHTLRALEDPSRIIRGLALRLLPLVCEEAQLQSALDTAPAHLRAAILWKLRQTQQQTSIDTFLEHLAAQGDAQLRQLLAFGSRDLVARLAEPLLQRAELADWTRLARFHADIALDLLQRWAESATALDQQLVNTVNALLPLVARTDSERALTFVITLRRTTPLTHLRLNTLVKHQPGAIADLLLAEKTRAYVSFTFGASVQRLSAAQILALYEEHDSTLGWYFAWFKQLTPEQRLAVYRAGERRFRHKGALPAQIVEFLPRAQREQEARKSIARFRSKPTALLQYAGFLPWDEAQTVLEPFLHASDASTRQSALRALLQVVRYNRGHLADALPILRTYRTEQDGVRRTILQGLIALPLSVWREEHLTDLAEIIRHGLNDVGLSTETLQAILNLLLKLLPAQLDWCAAQLATVLRERGLAASGRTESTFPANLADEQIHRLLELLLPVLETWLEREKEDEILTIAHWFASYKQAFDILPTLLEDLLRRTRLNKTAESILGLIARHRFARFQTLIPALLQEDQSWITFSAVSHHLLRRRQDLLAPFFRFQPYAGRWSTGQKRFLVPVSTRLSGVTAEQQERYAGALMEIINDEAQESQIVTQAVKTLALLPAIPPTHLKALANDQRSVVRTTALFALGHIDTDQGLPTLIEALQDARARIAIHVLRSFLLSMPPAQALAIIRTIPLNRVTVAKERVRLIGEIPSEEAYRELLALEKRKLHRDVHIALLRVLSKQLERPEVWPVLERAAHSSNTETVLAALPETATPLQLQKTVAGEAETVEQHLLQLIALLLNHSEKQVRLGALGYCSRSAIKDQQQAILPRLLQLLQAPTQDEYQTAAQAIFNVCLEDDGPLIAQAVRDLLAKRRVLVALIGPAQGVIISGKRPILSIIRLMLNALAEDPLTVSLRVGLAISCLPADELTGLFEALFQKNELHAEALMKACQILKDAAHRFDLAQLETFEATFATSKDERARRLAFAALEAQSSKTGFWDEARQARLQAYRADPSALVAAAAQFTLPNEDGEADDDDDDDWEEDW